MSLPNRRLLRPHRDWHLFDFVISAVSLVFLGIAASGALTLLGGLLDLSALGRDCASGSCTQTGKLSAHDRTYINSVAIFGAGGKIDHCVLTLDLAGGSKQAAVNGPACHQMQDGSPISAEVWRGNVVRADTQAGRMDTYLNPSLAVIVGLWRMLALVPFGIGLALIHIDFLNHHRVVRIRHRLFNQSPLPSSYPQRGSEHLRHHQDAAHRLSPHHRGRRG
jgi:hypothetical protein